MPLGWLLPKTAEVVAPVVRAARTMAASPADRRGAATWK